MSLMWKSKTGFLAPLLLALFYLTLLPFVVHAIGVIGLGLSGGVAKQSYLFVAGRPVGNGAMMLHILAGSVLITLVPLQLLRRLRTRHIRLHRALGKTIVSLALITGLTGMTYIPLRGTIGGPVMSAAFFLYGMLLFGSALMVAHTAIAKDRAGHWAWGLRLFWLALGSWLYRVHYTLWYFLTGGLWSNPAFTGAFDLVQNFAFYLPYLLIAELWIRSRGTAHIGKLVPSA